MFEVDQNFQTIRHCVRYLARPEITGLIKHAIFVLWRELSMTIESVFECSLPELCVCLEDVGIFGTRLFTIMQVLV